MTRGEVLCKLNQPECEETIAFENKLADYLFKARCKWEAKLGHPPTERDLDDYWLWESMVEERAWDDFYRES